MTTPRSQNEPDAAGPEAREERLGELINDFFDRQARGEALTQDEFLSRHPEFADELREHFRGLDFIHRLGGSSSGDTTVEGARVPVRGGSSAVDPLADDQAARPNIPGYQILKPIGRGGMGLVYKAMQLSTRRVVALKVLLEGPFATEAARHRFQREIALAAALRHPNIIPIYDSGTQDGRMYYAMEHVYGLSLTGYFKAHPPPIAARLRLFLKICDAVGHAHQRGVVHRDLKPNNILVDGAGEPHVLDFGLAKAGSLVDSDASVTAQVIGTPAYMSPEQASGDPGGIDTRTDVYSLGVMLYEVLTDRMPYDTTGPIGKTLTNIAHQDPVPPKKVKPGLNGDLSAIVLKALEKSRNDRYQSVDALRQDIKNYLDGEPVSAKPAGGLYLLRKAAWKHRAALGMAAVLVLFATVTWVVVRRSTAKLEEKVARVEQLEQTVREKEEEVAGLKQDRDELAAQSEMQRAHYSRVIAGVALFLPKEQQDRLAAIAQTGETLATGGPLAAVAQLLRDADPLGGVVSTVEKADIKMFGREPPPPALDDASAVLPDIESVSRFTKFLINVPTESTTRPADPDDDAHGPVTP